MRRVEVVEVGGHRVSVRELTVAEVRGRMLERGDQDAVSLLLFDDITLADLRAMTDASEAVMDDLTPSELDVIRSKARGLNPHFFDLMSRLRQAVTTH